MKEKTVVKILLIGIMSGMLIDILMIYYNFIPILFGILLGLGGTCFSYWLVQLYKIKKSIGK